MSGDYQFDDINDAKVDMDHIYNEPDPRAYFSELRKLDYRIPGVAKPIFAKLIAALRLRRGGRVHLLDVGCSYGVNGALLKHDLSMPDLYDHWTRRELARATPDEVIAYDRRYFGSIHEARDVEMIGLDQAEHAVAFAKEIGLIDEGIVANLEEQPLPTTAEPDLEAVDLVTSTGCVGYVTEKSFNRLLPVVTQGETPWIANFVLRMFPFDSIEETLSAWGYATEKLEGQTFVQRQFASNHEQQQILDELRTRGIDPAGKESAGELHADFYLSRPVEDVRTLPLPELLAA